MGDTRFEILGKLDVELLLLEGTTSHMEAISAYNYNCLINQNFYS